MNRTKIEWVKNPDGTPGYTWNPITGCLNHINGICKGGDFPCYAYRLANGRLRNRYLANSKVADISKRLHDANSSLWDRVAADPFYPRFWPERLYFDLGNNPKGIFVCDMSDLFGLGIPEEWTAKVLRQISYRPNHRFYLLTKQPQNLINFSPFPDNCWVGVTATNWLKFSDALGHLATIQAKVRYLSLEPLLGEIDLDMMQKVLFPRVINWVIIGAQTKPYKPPKTEWVQEIVEAADKAGIPVFLKNNLYHLFKHPEFENGYKVPKWAHADHGINMLRQELP